MLDGKNPHRMKRKSPKKAASQEEGLAIRPRKDASLSPAQLAFNRLMKNLEKANASYAREQARLDEMLEISIREWMPLVEDRNRLNRDIIICGLKALKTLKLTAKRKHWFTDLLSCKAADLLADPVGLSDAEIANLQAAIDELGPSTASQMLAEEEDGEFEVLRAMLEHSARVAGVELDLSDLDPKGDPEELKRIVRERLEAASGLFEKASSSARRPRKPTKAQAAKEQRRREIEEAKNRDLKSLFKQLAKAFHPDLEPDPLLKEHKKIWMQRLNTAYAASDLREMLQLEMEWLGEEATNLANAGEEKLKVYCMVLKEQIDERKAKTHHLKYEVQYGPLQRFIDPFFGTLASPKTIRRDLTEHLEGHRELLEILTRNDANARRTIYGLADEHAHHSSCPF